MKIKTRLRINILLPLTAFLLIAFVTVENYRNETALTLKRNTVREFSFGVFELDLLTMSYIQNPEERPRVQWERKYKWLQEHIKGVSFEEPEQNERFSNIKNNLERMGFLFNWLVELSGEKGGLDPELARQRKERLAGQLIVRAGAVSTDCGDLLVYMNKKIKAMSERALLLVLSVTGALIVLTVASINLINRRIGSSLDRLREGTEIIGAGNLDYRTGMEADDEIGELSLAFDTMTASLKETTVSRNELAAEVMERKRAEERVLHQNAVLDGIGRIFRETLAAESEEQLGRACLAIAEEVTGSKFGFIDEIGPDGFLHDIAISDPGWKVCTMYDKTGHRRPPGNFKVQGIYGRVFLDGRGFFTNDPASHPDSIGTPEGHPPLTAFLGAPLVHAGKTIGMVGVGNREGGYREEDLNALEALAVAIVEAFMRKRAETALYESEEDLNRAQAVAHTGSWRLNVQRNELVWSDETYRLFGIPRGTPLTYEAFLAAVHPDDREYLDREWQAALSGEPYDIEHRIIVEGQVKWVRERAELEFDEKGGMLGGFGTVQDMTERKRAEEKLRRAMEELERSNKELEQFAYVASHDLQEPLRAISGYVQLLQKRYRGKLDKDADDFINFAVEGAHRMQNLINDLLDFSRVGTTGKPLTRTESARALGAALRNMAADIEETRAVITTHDLPLVLADEGQLVQVFQNLLSNAIKFRKKDGPPRIHVSAEHRKNEGWVFSVRDNGIGMEPKYSDKVFQIFQRLQREYGGTGIGLAICKKIVERHGGRIWVESAPGEGSTFYFTLKKG